MLMVSVAFYAILSVIVVSLISVLAAIPFMIKKKVSTSVLLVLLSLSVGTLFGGAFIHFLPEAASHGYSLELSLFVLLGILVFFVLEKLVHWRHKCNNEGVGHSHAYHLAPINLIGDGIHNFIDGLVIAGSYLVSVPLGLAATISIIFHEVPQEIADFGVLLYAGLSKKKAVFYNLLSALIAIIGAVIGLVLGGAIEGFNHFLIPFAAGNFIYIAGSNLMPELHKECRIKDIILHVVAIVVGIGIMAALASVGQGHSH